MIADAIPLAMALALSAAVDQLARAFARATGPEWDHVSHLALWITDGLTLATLVLPKALELVNDTVRLLMVVLETAAFGLRRAYLALSGKDE